jgi:hypothetical protein
LIVALQQKQYGSVVRPQLPVILYVTLSVFAVKLLLL